MVPRCLNGHRVTMDAHREVMSGVVVASLARTTKFMRIFTLKIARRFDGGDGFCSVYMRCSLKVY